MSELKDYDIMDIEAMDDERLEKSKSGKIQATRVYIKSEADKVIAEKDEKINELEEHIDELQKATDSAWSKVNVYYDELCHSNHKRCVAIAKILEQESMIIKYRLKNEEWLDKWHKRWLELAEEPTWAKFLQLIRKEAK